jgi:hypothetical protein
MINLRQRIRSLLGLLDRPKTTFRPMTGQKLMKMVIARGKQQMQKWLTPSRVAWASVAVLISWMLLDTSWQQSLSFSSILVPSPKKALTFDHAVALNPQSSMFQDIVGIYHHAQEHAITIILRGNTSAVPTDMRQESNCLNPSFMIRLSGPALHMVPYHTVSQNETTTVLRGYYSVPVSGTYYLEVIVTLCNTLDEAKLGSANVSEQENPSAWAAAIQLEEEHIRSVCMVQPQHYTLTAQQNSTIPALAAVPLTNTSTPLPDNDWRGLQGFWISNRTIKDSVPLVTRFHPLDCAQMVNHECIDPRADPQRFSPYRFQWTIGPSLPVHEQEITTRIQQKSREYADQNANNTICLFGDSHIGELSNQWFKGPITAGGARYYQVYGQFASEFGRNITRHHGDNNDVLFQFMHKKSHTQFVPGQSTCTIALFGMGAWDAGWPENRPTTVSEYEADFLATVWAIQRAFPAAQVYIWNCHLFTLINYLYNPCPMNEWRTPVLIDSYNRALARVVNHLNHRAKEHWGSTSSLPPRAKYLDTEFITRPMWDSPPDWIHFANEVGRVESLYIAAVVLELVKLF